MNILIAIANYGTKNISFLKKLILHYKSLPYQIHICLLTERRKDIDSSVEQIIAIPNKNPWSLPFAHKTLFADRLHLYDLFIYSEDDTLISQINIEAFLWASSVLETNDIPGFLRIEIGPDNKTYISTMHSHYHWDMSSFCNRGGETFAYFTNEHSACFILTREQLSKAISSGGFLVKPHEGIYDMLCTAATDPYTQCGFRKLICISRLDDFLVQHLPNNYVGVMGAPRKDALSQIDALHQIAAGRLNKSSILPEVPATLPPPFHMQYYASPCEMILKQIPKGRKDVLSVGCGQGLMEERIQILGHNVTAIPIDSVIAASAKRRGISLQCGTLDEAFSSLLTRRFDAVIFSRFLHLIQNPDKYINAAVKLLNPGGMLISHVLNLNRLMLLLLSLKNSSYSIRNIRINNNTLSSTTINTLRSWYAGSELKSIKIYGQCHPKLSLIPKVFSNRLKWLFSKEFLAIGIRE